MINNIFDFKYRFRRISNLFLKLGNKLKPDIAEPYHEPYSTHIPILIALSKLVRVEKVLELGSGVFSTGTFLNKEIFPFLSTLDSFENDSIWASEILSRFGADKRLNLNLIQGPIQESLSEESAESYDLIFIDDSVCVEDRAKTIKYISEKKIEKSIVVIHDFEIRHYRIAARNIRNYFTFYSFTPCTGVLWNKRLKKEELMMKLRIIESNKHQLEAEDYKSWLKVL